MTVQHIISFLALHLASEQRSSNAPRTGNANPPVISSRIDVANANRRASCACNSTLMITCWPAAVYLLSCSLAVCCVIEFGWPEGWKAWGEKRFGGGLKTEWRTERGGGALCVYKQYVDKDESWMGWGGGTSYFDPLPLPGKAKDQLLF